MPILNYTTAIDAWKTISEIQMILSKHGATHFAIKNEGARPVAVSFSIDYNGEPLNFLLPCKSDKVLAVIKADKKASLQLKRKGKLTEEQAYRVSWRIIKDWIEAQLALVQVEMARMEEVFMPYLILNDKGETLAQRILNDNGLKLLK